jgi:hypothetical protein
MRAITYNDEARVQTWEPDCSPQVMAEIKTSPEPTEPELK